MRRQREMNLSKLENLSQLTSVALIPCESSNIEAFGYGPKSKSLWVLFKNNVIYKYKDISYDSFIGLLNAESKGKWVNENLRKDEIKFSRFKVEQ